MMQKNLLMITKSTPKDEILKLAPDCTCHHCSHGCTIGSGFLAEDDYGALAELLGISVEELKEKHLEEANLFNKALHRPKLNRKKGMPFGSCTFFNRKEERCSVHAAKPLQCRVSMGCKEYGEQLQQWFMLNHLIDFSNPESIRQYAQYLKAGGKTIHGGGLSELVPDMEFLKKVLDYEIV
ncbi:TPA: YkgJ family cysteine cluster protein [Candidatus Woesearchaeota archaeon]|nr:YkgJ family cysteine cluster protein [Candidatus Woesearchaeota archaeon]HII69205.1 YkgJ family cysteine cluster protein [Candidatus Woesearchaeota archaeon]